MKKTLSALLAAATAATLATPRANAQGYQGPYDFYMDSSDTANTTSFASNTSLRWYTNSVPPAAMPPAFAPGAGIYLVGGNNWLRPPAAGGPYTFNGDVLVIDNNARYVDKVNTANGTTFNTLILRGGMFHGDNNTKTLRGNYHIPAGATGRIECADGGNRWFNLAANFSGPGTLSLDIRNVSVDTFLNLNDNVIGSPGVKGATLQGDNSGLSGPVRITGGNGSRTGGTPNWGFDTPSRESRVIITGEAHLGTPLAFDAEQLYINNAVLELAGNPTVITNSNRGIFIGAGNAMFENAHGAVIGGPVAGPGALFKRGAGALLLNGANTMAALTVEAGAIGGTGSVSGPVAFTGDANIDLAGNGCGVFALSNPAGLTLHNGALSFDLRDNQTGGPSDRLDIGGPLTLAGNTVVSINPLDGALSAGHYTLVNYASLDDTAGDFLLDPNPALQGADLVVGLASLQLRIGGGISCKPATNIAKTSATLNADMTFPNMPEAVSAHWGLVDYAWAGSGGAAFSAATQPLAVNAGGLISGTNYIFRFKAEFNGGATIVWSEPWMFTTKTDLPEIEMLDVVANTTADVTATVRLVWAGSAPAAKITLYWGAVDGGGSIADWVSNNPGCAPFVFDNLAAGSHALPFAVPLENVRYYCRAFATGASGDTAAALSSLTFTLYTLTASQVKTVYWGGGHDNIPHGTPLATTSAALGGTWNKALKNWSVDPEGSQYVAWEDGADMTAVLRIRGGGTAIMTLAADVEMKNLTVDMAGVGGGVGFQITAGGTREIKLSGENPEMRIISGGNSDTSVLSLMNGVQLVAPAGFVKTGGGRLYVQTPADLVTGRVVSRDGYGISINQNNGTGSMLGVTEFDWCSSPRLKTPRAP